MSKEEGKKIYISGKVSGELPYRITAAFGYASSTLRTAGCKVINPLVINGSLANQGFTYDDLMHMCYAAIDICDAVYMLENWKDSKGAQLEREYAIAAGKEMLYQGGRNG